MRSFSRTKHVLWGVGAVVATLSSVLSVSAAAPTEAELDGTDRHRARICARQFEEAQRIDMESYRDFDAETFRAIHHPDAITIFGTGAVRSGIDAIMAAHAGHFAAREAIWAWTEVSRVVDGCNAAFILYNATYDIPSSGFHLRALVGVTYTYQNHRWLAISDQSTRLPEATE
jgi:hypothetical protein